jgi:Domain of unknown function (DUF4340)
MKPRNLVVAAVILAALSGAVWWAKKHPSSGTTSPSTPPAPKIADIPQNRVKSIDIAKKGSPVLTLESENGRWRVTAPGQYPADQDAVTTLLSSLSPLNADTVVEDNSKNLSPFGLSNPSLTVTVHETNGQSDQFSIGNDVPAGSLVYLKTAAKPAVYAVSNSVKSGLDKSVNDLRDKRLLTFDSNKVTSVDLVSSKGGDLAFAKNNQGDWQITKPQPYRADSFQVEDLLRKLGDAKMDLSTSAENQKKVDAAFATAQPVGTAKLTDAAGTQTLEIKKNKDDYYAKSSVVKGFYKVSSDLGQEVGKGLDDFRNKKVFDFGFNDPTKIELQQAGSDKTYTRSGTDWKANGQTMDAGSVQAFIDKLRDLSATKFPTTGFTTPADTITVTSNDGKRVEKVEFAKVADGYIARRENEPSLYQTDAKAMSDILEAGKGIKATGSGGKK